MKINTALGLNNARMGLLALAAALTTGCAGSRQVVSQSRVPSRAEVWDSWSARYRAELAAATTGKTAAERGRALERLVDFGDQSPNSESRALVTKNTCILAAAEGAAVVLERLGCANGALHGLLGRE